MNNSLKIFLCISFLLASCSETAPPPVSKKSASNGFAGISLNKPPVDGSKLAVYDISVAKVKQGDIWLGSLNYSASGQADYVKFKACHNETSECFSGSAAVNRVLMPPFPLGKVTITAQACADSGRSTSGSDCGEISSGQFIQPNNIDQVKYELAAKRAVKVAQIKTYGALIKKAILKFEKGIEECEHDAEDYKRLMLKKQMALSYIALGDALLSESLTGLINRSGNSDQGAFDPSADQKSNGQNSTSKINQTDIGPVMEGVKSSADGLQEFTEYSNIVKGAFQSAGMYEREPVSAIQSLSSVVFDLFTADKVAKKCFAEKNANREIDVIKEQVNKLKKDVLAIDLELGVPAGGL